jgi:hypothetical protein
MTLISVQDAATMFSASKRGVEEWIRAGMPAQKVKQKKGAPRWMVDVEGARTWLIEKNVRTFIKSEVAQSEQTPKAPAEVKPAEPSKVNITPGVGGAVERLRQIELRAFSDYVRARNAGDVLGQRAHMKLHSEAVRRMLEAEDVSGQLAEIRSQEQARAIADMTAWAEPVKALIDQMPRSVAIRCNVTDPATAEAALREWVLKELYPIMARKM